MPGELFHSKPDLFPPAERAQFLPHLSTFLSVAAPARAQNRPRHSPRFPRFPARRESDADARYRHSGPESSFEAPERHCLVLALSWPLVALDRGIVVKPKGIFLVVIQFFSGFLGTACSGFPGCLLASSERSVSSHPARLSEAQSSLALARG